MAQVVSATGYLHDDGAGIRVWRNITSSDVTTALGFTPLNAIAQASDSAKLGGVAAASYATQTYVTGLGYITGTGNTTGSSGSCTGTSVNATNLTGTTQAASITWNGSQTINAQFTVTSSANTQLVVLNQNSTVDGAAALRINNAASTGSSYGVYANLSAASGYQNIAIFASASGAATLNYSFYGAAGVLYNAGNINTQAVYTVAGVQVLKAQQTGLGAQITAYTLTGTYSTDLAKLQSLYNKVVAIETILRAHGLATT